MEKIKFSQANHHSNCQDVVDKTAILLITFNRPDTTIKVLESIRQYQPKKLYVFSDGPRANNFEADLEKIMEVRTLFDSLDWDCELIRGFNTENQGCGLGVSGAISWAFETEEKLVILEDDCVPSQAFFPFCDNLLSKYEHDEHVMHIAGTRWNEEYLVNDSSYFFSSYAHIWGWATWKRAWKRYDFLMEDWPEFKRKKRLNQLLNNYFPLIKRWQYMFDNIYNLKRKHTWDYQWQYAVFKNSGLCITPIRNMVTNVGDVGVHFSERTSAHYRERSDVANELLLPESFQNNKDFDFYHGKSFFLEGRSPIRLFYDQTIGRLQSIIKG